MERRLLHGYQKLTRNYYKNHINTSLFSLLHFISKYSMARLKYTKRVGLKRTFENPTKRSGHELWKLAWEAWRRWCVRQYHKTWQSLNDEEFENHPETKKLRDFIKKHKKNY